MRSEVAAAVIEGCIPLAFGLYITMLGYRRIGKPVGESLEYDGWHERFGGRFKLLGPFLVVFGLIVMARGVTIDAPPNTSDVSRAKDGA